MVAQLQILANKTNLNTMLSRIRVAVHVWWPDGAIMLSNDSESSNQTPNICVYLNRLGVK